MRFPGDTLERPLLAWEMFLGYQKKSGCTRILPSSSLNFYEIPFNFSVSVYTNVQSRVHCVHKTDMVCFCTFIHCSHGKSPRPLWSIMYIFYCTLGVKVQSFIWERKVSHGFWANVQAKMYIYTMPVSRKYRGFPENRPSWCKTACTRLMYIDVHYGRTRPFHLLLRLASTSKSCRVQYLVSRIVSART